MLNEAHLNEVVQPPLLPRVPEVGVVGDIATARERQLDILLWRSVPSAGLRPEAWIHEAEVDPQDQPRQSTRETLRSQECPGVAPGPRYRRATGVRPFKRTGAHSYSGGNATRGSDEAVRFKE